ncbi:MAG: PA14 domain-containing protein [Anaerolineae bacterium]|nr:PA14 domain-containing protein [Anaerolineae bacterium]
MSSRFRFLLVFAALLLALVAVGAAEQASAADAAWRAHYYNNTDLSGTPVIIRDEANIDYSWGTRTEPAPGVNVDNFSVEWKRNVDFNQAGIYRFTATMDDGMRVIVGGSTVIDEWRPGSRRTVTVERYFNAGLTHIQVQYFDAVLFAEARFSWQFVSAGSPTINNWRGEYFNNTSVSGSPVAVRDDANINFDWGNGSPVPGVVNSDNFSVRWTRTVNFTPGRYRITATADDGMRVWINNQLLIDQWRDQTATTYTAEVTLPGGALPVRVEYYDHGGGAIARASWTAIAATINNWRGEYFNNTSLSGNPVAIRDDASIDFNWSDGVPVTGMARDNFSVRWTRNLSLTPGRYRFTTTTDDGVRLWVNNQLLIDRWYPRAVTSDSAEINISSSSVPVRMEYFEQNGFAQARLSWTRVNGGPSPNPAPLPGQGTATINTARLNVRSGPGIGNAIITVVSRGQVLPLAGYRDASATWVMITLPNGTTGWIHASYILTNVQVSSLVVWSGTAPAPAPTPAPAGNATVATYHLNMRSGPGIAYNVLTVLDLGQTMTLLGRNSAANWVKVSLPSGATGWVHANYIRTTVSINTLPIVG